MSDTTAWIMQQNIQRFSEQLRCETNDERRKTLSALLDAEHDRHRCFAEQNAPQLIVSIVRSKSLPRRQPGYCARKSKAMLTLVTDKGRLRLSAYQWRAAQTRSETLVRH